MINKSPADVVDVSIYICLKIKQHNPFKTDPICMIIHIKGLRHNTRQDKEGILDNENRGETSVKERKLSFIQCLRGFLKARMT